MPPPPASFAFRSKYERASCTTPFTANCKRPETSHNEHSISYVHAIGKHIQTDRPTDRTTCFRATVNHRGYSHMPPTSLNYQPHLASPQDAVDIACRCKSAVRHMLLLQRRVEYIRRSVTSRKVVEMTATLYECSLQTQREDYTWPVPSLASQRIIPTIATCSLLCKRHETQSSSNINIIPQQ